MAPASIRCIFNFVFGAAFTFDIAIRHYSLLLYVKMFAGKMWDWAKIQNDMLNQLLKRWKHNKGDQHERQPATNRLI